MADCGFSWYSPGYGERIQCVHHAKHDGHHRGPYAADPKKNRAMAFVVVGGEHLVPQGRWETMAEQEPTSLRMKLAKRIGDTTIAVQNGESEEVLLGMLRGDLTWKDDKVVPTLPLDPKPFIHGTRRETYVKGALFEPRTGYCQQKQYYDWTEKEPPVDPRALLQIIDARLTHYEAVGETRTLEDVLYSALKEARKYVSAAVPNGICNDPTIPVEEW